MNIKRKNLFILFFYLILKINHDFFIQHYIQKTPTIFD